MIHRLPSYGLFRLVFVSALSLVTRCHGNIKLARWNGCVCSRPCDSFADQTWWMNCILLRERLSCNSRLKRLLRPILTEPYPYAALPSRSTFLTSSFSVRTVCCVNRAPKASPARKKVRAWPPVQKINLIHLLRLP